MFVLFGLRVILSFHTRVGGEDDMTREYLRYQYPSSLRVPDEEIAGTSGATLGDFWSWGYSDVLGNTTRGVFAEYLVASALGVADACRKEWDSVDIEYRKLKIEVKSASEAKSWRQEKPSLLRFSIEKKRSWHAETNTHDAESKRSADCYVFCVLENPGSDPRRNIIDVSNWEFTVVPTSVLDERFGDQKTVSYDKIRRLGTVSEWKDLRRTVCLCMRLSNDVA